MTIFFDLNLQKVNFGPESQQLVQLVKEKGSLFSKQKHCQTITRWQQNWLMPKPHPVVETNRIRSSSVSWRLGCWTMTFTIWIASTQRLRIEIHHPSKFKAQFVTKTICQQLLRMLSLHLSHRWFFGGYFFLFIFYLKVGCIIVSIILGILEYK